MYHNVTSVTLPHIIFSLQMSENLSTSKHCELHVQLDRDSYWKNKYCDAVESKQKVGPSGVPQMSVLKLEWFNIFINYMGSEIEAMFIKFTNYTKLRTDQSTWMHRLGIQIYFQEEKIVKK